MKKRLALFTILLALTILGSYGYYTVWNTFAFAPDTNSSNSNQTSFNKTFTLVNQNGETVTNATYLGKPTLYFFGFTHCPDICPTTLSTLTNWLTQLGDDAKNLNVVFISIDPERDTPAVLKDYIANFHPTISAATGAPQQLEEMAKIFMVYYAKVPAKPGENPANYTMSHSSMILMADRNGIFTGTLDSHDVDEKAISKLKQLLKD